MSIWIYDDVSAHRGGDVNGSVTLTGQRIAADPGLIWSEGMVRDPTVNGTLIAGCVFPSPQEAYLEVFDLTCQIPSDIDTVLRWKWDWVIGDCYGGINTTMSHPAGKMSAYIGRNDEYDITVSPGDTLRWRGIVGAGTHTITGYLDVNGEPGGPYALVATDDPTVYALSITWADLSGVLHPPFPWPRLVGIFATGNVQPIITPPCVSNTLFSI